MSDAPHRGVLARASTRGRAEWRRPATRRTGWVMVSQSLSSLSTLVVTVAVARSVDADSFGRFSLGFLIYVATLSLTRALIMQPLAIRFSLGAPETADAVRRAAGAAVLIGATVGVVVAGAGLALGGEAGRVLLVLAVGLPALMLQDLWRFAFFSLAEPWRAATNDLVWLVSQCALTAAVLAVAPGAIGLTAAWVAGGCIAALWGAVQIHAVPDLTGLSFVVRHRDLGWRFAGEYAVFQGASYAVVVLLVPLFGVAEVGGLRGAFTLFGPYTTVIYGVTSAALSEGSRLLASRPERFLFAQRAAGVALAALAGVWGIMLLVIPAGWGRALLGDTWSYARPLVGPITAGEVGAGLACGALMGLRSLTAAGAVLRLRVVASIATVGCALLGAQWGMAGATWGMAVGGWILAVGSWRALGRGFASAPRPVGEPGGVVAAPLA